MKKVLPLLFLVVCGIACGPDVPNLDSPGKTIVVLGDSIASGVGSGPGEAYPELLAARLGRRRWSTPGSPGTRRRTAWPGSTRCWRRIPGW